MLKLNVVIGLIAFSAVACLGQGVQRSTEIAPWAATDALGRRIDPAQYPQARSNRFVGIFYFLWMQGGSHDHVYDITKILAADPLAPKWGPKSAFHWWGQPYLGYYRSDDEWLIARHAQMLSDAGVDVIILDVTNALTYDPTLQHVFAVYSQLRAAGRRTPQIAFIVHSKSAKTVTHLYDTIYAPNKYSDLWFRWKGKPLLMASASGLPAAIADFFTLRESWAWSSPNGWFGNGRGKWPWLDNTPQKFGWIASPDKPEEMPVAVAQHPVTPLGRSYHDGKQPPADRIDPARGAYFAEQWKRALAVDPEFIFITGWNEWIAQRFISDGKTGPKHVGYKNLHNGDSFFVDTFSQEFSRDIEPMAGGHGDDFYYQMADGIRRFKGVGTPPISTGAKTIQFGQGFDQWHDVLPAYYDDVGDTTVRDSVGYGDAGRLTNNSGRNDLELCRVSYDNDMVYFYVRTKAGLTSPTAENWMTLLIRPVQGRPDGDALIAINRLPPLDGHASVEKNGTGSEWALLGSARIEWAGNQMQVAVARTLIDAARGPLHFDFKWIDNAPIKNPLAWIDQGDVAPNGRFFYNFMTN